MICPYCEQGLVLPAQIKKTNKRILICDECDTIWLKDVNLQTGMGFDAFMKKEGCEANWDELEILE